MNDELITANLPQALKWASGMGWRLRLDLADARSEAQVILMHASKAWDGSIPFPVYLYTKLKHGLCDCLRAQKRLDGWSRYYWRAGKEQRISRVPWPLLKDADTGHIEPWEPPVEPPDYLWKLWRERALAAIPIPKDRFTLERLLEGYTKKEIAVLLGVTHGMITRRTKRALQAIAKVPSRRPEEQSPAPW